MKMQINFNGKIFRAIQNDETGDVSGETRFYYHQHDDYLWGSYAGGDVRAGVLIGKVLQDNQLDFNYAHYDLKDCYRTGHCRSTAETMGGKIRLHEEWQWTNGNKLKGTSIIEEVNE